MKKRFLPFSLLLVIMILGQSVMADQGGHYVPRAQATMNAESFMGSLRANQNTGLIDPADMFKAMQAPAMKNGAGEPLYWISMGPDNMGGQTNAIVYDNTKNAHGNPNGIVYIGSKGGGVYKTYNNGTTWHQVGDLNLMVSTMVQDEDGVIYVGTGDGGDNINQNGLTQMGYSNSFIGTGIWAIDARNNDATEQIVAPTAEEWLYINELAIANGKLIAATSDGLRYSTDKGATWNFAKALNADGEAEDLTDEAVEVKVGVDNLIVASVAGSVYIGYDIDALECHTGTSSSMQGDTLLPKAASLYDIAVSPTNEGVIYAASIDAGVHKGIFRSDNYGKNWITVLPAVGSNLGHSVYEGYGLYNHGIVIDPVDDGTLYVLGYNLWRVQRTASGTGYYLCECLTSNSTIGSSYYIHVGLHAMTFNPDNANEFYVGSDGGIFKGARDFSFYNCNRNYVTSRMFSVAYCGKDARVLAAGIDHGTVLIEGDETANTMGTGLWINPMGDNMGAFSDDSHAGHCAISNINPNTVFVTTKGGSYIYRSETAGEDWVSTNFTSAVTINTNVAMFRMPMLLKEEYENDLNPFTVWYHNVDTLPIPGGTRVQVMSSSNFPFYYTLPHHLDAGDSIEVHDPISARLYFSVKNSVYMTLTPLNFAVETEWHKVADNSHSNFKGDPVCMAVTFDADHLFVGMKDGKLYRISNLNSVVDSNTGTITDSLFAVTTTPIEVLVDSVANTQCVTSVSVDPRNNNNVLITLGNYGNKYYVFYSTNALSEAPTFNPVQGNLPKMPVYSSLIEMETGDVIIGTERGIYRCTNIANPEWVSDGKMMGEVPVMELKQQTLFHEDEQTVHVSQDGIFITDYPGVHNTGVIYAATYGRGVFRCENYKKDFESVPETPAVAENVTVSLYPNPVQSQATVNFDVKDNTNVNYQVFDLAGRMVMNQSLGRFAEGSHQFQINVENLSTGSYILRLNQNGNSACVKFLVY